MLISQFQNVLRRYGRSMTLRHQSVDYPLQAYVSLLTYRNRDYLEDRYSQLGTIDQNAFLCLASPSGSGSLIQSGDFILDSGESFLVTTSEMIRFAQQSVYVWAILRRASGLEVL